MKGQDRQQIVDILMRRSPKHAEKLREVHDILYEMGFNLPLGHAAVIAVNRQSGKTTYYEYGRYDKEKKGKVERRSVPNLVMKNGKPTDESLSNLYKFISKNYGKDSVVDAAYYPDADDKKIIEYAKKRMKNKNPAPYNLLLNNCKTFARDAIEAGLIK